MDIRKDLFTIFQENNKDLFLLYENIIKYTEHIVEKSKGEENAKFYYLTNQLLCSINNYGWEDRHAQQIDLLWKAQKEIIDHYEKYLP